MDETIRLSTIRQPIKFTDETNHKMSVASMITFFIIFSIFSILMVLLLIFLPPESKEDRLNLDNVKKNLMNWDNFIKQSTTENDVFLKISNDLIEKLKDYYFLEKDTSLNQFNLVIHQKNNQNNTNNMIIFSSSIQSSPELPNMNLNLVSSSILLEILLNFDINDQNIKFLFFKNMNQSKFIENNLSNIQLLSHFYSLASQNGIYTLHDDPDMILKLNTTHDFTIAPKFQYFNLTTFSFTSNYDPKHLKTFQEKQRFGGISNTILDPCYNKTCDNFENIDLSQDTINIMKKIFEIINEPQ